MVIRKRRKRNKIGGTMKIVSLFNTDMEYKKFISEIKNNRKLTSHEELKPYRKNINIFLLYLNYNVTNEELDKIVNFVQNLGDVSLHYNVLEAIRIAFDNKVDSLIKGLTILYDPLLTILENPLYPFKVEPLTILIIIVSTKSSA